MRDIVTFDEQEGVLWVSGKEDRTTSGLRRRALSAALRASQDVTVDLRELTLADASLMVDLAVLAQRLRLEGHAMRMRAPQPHIHRLIETVGLHRQPAVALDV